MTDRQEGVVDRHGPAKRFPIITAGVDDGGIRLSMIRCATFAATKDHIAAARRLARETLADHPAGELAVVLISELATNAVQHSGSPQFTLMISRNAKGELYIKVVDDGQGGLPSLRTADPDDENGRGIRLVETLTRRWGITRERGVGMAVWFHIDQHATQAWLNLLLADHG